MDAKLNENKQVDSSLINLLNSVKDKADNELDRYKAQAEEIYQNNVILIILITDNSKVKSSVRTKLNSSFAQTKMYIAFWKTIFFVEKQF